MSTQDATRTTPVIYNITSGDQYQGIHSQGRFFAEFSLRAMMRDISLGDVLSAAKSAGSAPIHVVVHRESYANGSGSYLGVDALTLGHKVTIARGKTDIATVQAHIAAQKLTNDPLTDVLADLAAATRGPLFLQRDVLNRLTEVQAMLDPADILVDQFKQRRADYEAQTRIIALPGSGAAIGDLVSTAQYAGPFLVEGIDRRSLQGLEIWNCRQS